MFLTLKKNLLCWLFFKKNFPNCFSKFFFQIFFQNFFLEKIFSEKFFRKVFSQKFFFKNFFEKFFSKMFFQKNFQKKSEKIFWKKIQKNFKIKNSVDSIPSLLIK